MRLLTLFPVASRLAAIVILILLMIYIAVLIVRGAVSDLVDLTRWMLS